MDSEAPRISVVIPVYQTVDYLDQCLESVMLHLPSGSQVLLVDDGSTDGSGEKCDAWAATDCRIDVIHQLNRGLSEARNVGIAHARGEYLLFIDSDDVISPELITFMMTLARRHNPDMVVSRGVRFSSGAPLFEPSSNFTIGSGRDLLPQRIAGGRDWEVWGSLYRRALLGSGVRFKTGIHYEDLEFTPRVMLAATTVILCDARLYGYRVRPESIMARSEIEVSPDLIEVIASNLELVSQSYDPTSDAYRILVRILILHAAKRLERIQTREAVKRNRPFLKAYRGLIRENLPAVLTLADVSFAYRVLIAASATSPRLSIEAFRLAAKTKDRVPSLSRMTRRN